MTSGSAAYSIKWFSWTRA